MFNYKKNFLIITANIQMPLFYFAVSYYEATCKQDGL